MLKKWHTSTAYPAWTKEEEGEDAWMEFMSPHFQEVAYLSSGADPLLVQNDFSLFSSTWATGSQHKTPV